jgi:hypothetical protein
MYDAGSPPEKFVAGEPWAGYLQSPHPFAVWPVEALKAAIASDGLCPIWGAPLSAEAFAASNPADEAHEAVRQVKALGGGSIVVATDVEEVGYESDKVGSVQWSLKCGQGIIHEGGLWVAYGGKEYLTDLLAAIRRTSLKCAPWVANYTTHPGYPVPGWPAGDRGWQYVGNVQHNGKTVDISTIEPGFPLVHAKRPADEPTDLTRRARRAGRVWMAHMTDRDKHGHPVSAKDRPEAEAVEAITVKVLGL